jgi:alcohol dehydrogenase
MASFIIPRFVHHGLGTFGKLGELHGKKAVIVTGESSMRKAGHVAKAGQLLERAGIASAVFDGVEADPSFETVHRGAQFLKREAPDLIVGLGGCSAIDAAKAMWIFYEHPGVTVDEIIKPFNIKPLRQKARFVAVPSTSGTGTEVTCVAVITDRRKGTKHPLVSYELTPDVAIVDGEICQDMPAHVTANTGLDALSHDVEAFVAALADEYTDSLAKRSVAAIFKHLPTATTRPSDLEARQAMHDASCWAGMAFTNALLGIVHAMSHQLGGSFGIPHGRANAILMPNVIRYNSKATAKYAELAAVLGKATAFELAESVEGLASSVGIEPDLKRYGVSEQDFSARLDQMTRNALNDPCAGTNPRKPTFEDVKKIYQFCFIGERVSF